MSARRIVGSIGLLAWLFLLAGSLAPSRAYAQKLVGQAKTLPIVISKSGSYKLRSNIVVPDANTTAIEIRADNVTLDLGGFSILGPTSCTVGPANTLRAVLPSELVTVSLPTIPSPGGCAPGPLS